MTTERIAMIQRWTGLMAALASTISVLLFAPAASATLLQPGGFAVTTTTSQAGAHPDITTSFSFVADSNGVVSEHQKDVVVDLPPGFVGEPTAVPGCPLATFNSNISTGNESCPAGTQVGTATLTATFVPGNPQSEQVPLYNIVPDAGEVAKFAFSVAASYGIQLVASVRPGDFGVRTTVRNASSLIDLDSVSVTLWGVPADPSHDAQRGEWCFNGGSFCFNGGLSAGANPAPLLTNPTECGGPLTATVHADSWENQARFNADGSPDFSDPTWQTQTSDLPAVTGCDHLSFQPTLSVRPTETQASTPTGLVADLKVPQDNDPNGIATAELRRAVVTLPSGIVLSPSAADGLKACTDAEVGLGSASAPDCSLASKIGTATLLTPALPDPLTGNIYLAGPPGGPITGPPYRIFLTLAGDGVLIKLQGSVVPNPATGQLTTTFDNNPQQPFSELRLEFKGGPRAPLANPRTCGTFAVTSDLEPWSAPDSGPDATPSDSFTIGGCGDPNRFAPSFKAGTISPVAGAFSPFVLSFSRDDSDQELSGLTATLPPGMVAKLAGIPLCSTAAADAGVCPDSSQVGTVETGAGPGSNPFFLRGKAFLTGPYKGAPYGLAVVVPAVAGPFDLGTVVVRQALFIDPTDAHVTVRSDSFPTILKGIPLQLRRVDVTLDRPHFMINPTSCSPMRVAGLLSSTSGRAASVSSRFQVGDCANLRFAPNLRLALTGKGHTRSGTHPALVATLAQGSNQANIRAARVTLPLSLALDPGNSQHVCSFQVAQAVHGGAVGCPAATVVGAATAKTPLLSQPLTGKVYLVQGIRFSHGQAIRTLPTLLVALRGQIALDLRAQTSVDGAKRLVTTFGTLPDAAVSSFKLIINGGPRGLLVITGRGRTICNAPQVALARFDGHSGAVERLSPTMSKPCRRRTRRK
jgi:hypothetical protein